MTTSTLASRNGIHTNGSHAVPDFEVPAQARRRRLSASYKMRILCEADGCPQGELGALLRREGLYSSQLATWRKQRKAGTLTALAPQRGRPALISAEVAALAAARAENERLTRQLAAAEAIIEIQKKVSSLLALTLPSVPSGPQP